MATVEHYAAKARHHARNALAAIKCHDVAEGLGLHILADMHARHAREEAATMRKANRAARALAIRAEESALRAIFKR